MNFFMQGKFSVVTYKKGNKCSLFELYNELNGKLSIRDSLDWWQKGGVMHSLAFCVYDSLRNNFSIESIGKVAYNGDSYVLSPQLEIIIQTHKIQMQNM